MRLFHRTVALARALFRSSKIDADLAGEMRFHIERETEANIARGMSPDDARRSARLAFGSVDDFRETSADERPGATARRFMRDVRFGTRLLRKSPVFAVTAITIVALGIGAATAIFSVLYGTMLRPLPYTQPERLVRIWLLRHGNRNYPAAADVVDFRTLRAFDDVADYQDINLNLVGGAEPQRLQGAAGSANLFSVLRARAAIGRTFLPGEDAAGHDHVVVLSDALWRGRFGADPNIVGKTIRLNDFAYRVIGVMPHDFQFPSSAYDAWVPHVVPPDELTRTSQDNYVAVARLARSVTIQQVRAEADALAKRLTASYKGYKDVRITALPMLDDVVRDVRPALVLLMAGVSLFLLIASINLSSLFAARARTRLAEFAVRLALGASRPRLLAQIVAEAVPILAIGGFLGLVAAEATVRWFVATASPGVPRIESISVSLPVLVFSFSVLVISGLAASVAPAIHAWKTDFIAASKDGGRGATRGRRRAMNQRAGVAAQIALALPLLAGASLLIRSAINVMHVDLGFSTERLTTLKFEASRVRHPTDRDVAAYYTQLLERVRALPGVQAASLVNRIPLSDMQTNPVYFRDPTTRVLEQSNVDSRTVGTGYFATLGIALIAGRDFTDRDDAQAPRVAIVDERVARRMWPGESPVGKRFREPPWRGGEWVTVIGVVGHVHTASFETDPLPQVYWSYRQWTQDEMVLAVRSAADQQSLLPAVTRAIHSVDPEQSVYDVNTMATLVDHVLAQRWLTTILIAGFAGFALVLAAVGLYGVVAFDVAHRLRELGIRVALGATPSDIVRLIVRSGTTTALVGAAAGLVLAVVAAGIVRTIVYGVAPRDAVSLGAATFSLLIVAALASYLPARRAGRVDPATTLRTE
jgi:putative ABC transport system permease protein